MKSASRLKPKICLPTTGDSIGWSTWTPTIEYFTWNVFKGTIIAHHLLTGINYYRLFTSGQLCAVPRRFHVPRAVSRPADKLPDALISTDQINNSMHVRRPCKFFFSLTFLSSRLNCCRYLIVVTHPRHSELGVGHWRIVFSLIPLPAVSRTFGIRTSYNLDIRFALLTGEFRRRESARHVTQRRATVPLFLGALTFKNAFWCARCTGRLRIERFRAVASGAPAAASRPPAHSHI